MIVADKLDIRKYVKEVVYLTKRSFRESKKDKYYIGQDSYVDEIMKWFNDNGIKNNSIEEKKKVKTYI